MMLSRQQKDSLKYLQKHRKHRQDKINIKDTARVNLLYYLNVVLKAGFLFCLKKKNKLAETHMQQAPVVNWRQNLTGFFQVAYS